MTMEDRLEKLEREFTIVNRRNRLLLGGTVLFLAGFFVVAATPRAEPQAKTQIVKATELVLVDAQGRLRGRLGMDNRLGPTLSLWDENGKTRAALFVSKDGPGLTLFDENNQSRVLMVSYTNGPSLFMLDENDCARVHMSVAPFGPMLSLSDERQLASVGMVVVHNEGPRLAICDENGKRRVQMDAFKNGPTLSLLDENEKPRWKAP